MKTIKTLISISLLNLLIVSSIVVAFSGKDTSASSINKVNNPSIIANLPTKTPLPSSTPINNNTQSPQNPQTPQSTPTNTPIPIDTPKPDPLANRCIIIIDGGKYDITDFRNIHSGGDIFQCGTDMSSIFHGQHNDSTLLRMQQYRVS
jgi:hypothetical protein